MADKQPPQCRILVMASGSGSNFQALINGVASGAIPHSTISQLIVNRGQAYATTRADEAGIPWAYFNLVSHGFLPKGEKDESVVAAGRARYDAALADRIIKGEGGSGKPDLIVLAGFMHVLSASFLEPLEKEGIRVINLHPALPGEYNGAGAIERAFKDFQAGKITRTGIMVHYVVLEVDMGAPILTREVPLLEGDDLATVQQRIHSHEHELIVEATAKVAREITGVD